MCVCYVQWNASCLLSIQRSNPTIDALHDTAVQGQVLVCPHLDGQYVVQDAVAFCGNVDDGICPINQVSAQGEHMHTDRVFGATAAYRSACLLCSHL